MALSVGFAKDVITPPLGMHIPGHGAVPRPSLGIADDLYLYALAFSDGENRAVLFNCDALGVTTKGGERIRKKVSECLGIPLEHIFIACTHCHTAMFLGGSVSLDDPFGAYHRQMDELFCSVAQRAFDDLLHSKILISRDELQDVGFIRRYRLKDGTLRTNPPYQHPDLLDFDGIQDPSLQLIRFEREGGKEVVLINFSTHPDVVGGQYYTPDWPGFTADLVRSALGNHAEVVVINGFSGDSNHTYRFAPKPTCSKMEFAYRMARKIGGEALKIYDDAKEVWGGTVMGLETVAHVEKNPHEVWEEPIAEEIVACKAKKETELPEHLRAYKMSLKKAARIVSNKKQQGNFTVKVYALRVGPLVFVGFPGEPFCETGLNIKEKSPMEMTVCTCRTNGSEGYFPTRRAFDGAGYERDYTKFGPNCAEKLEEAALALLEKMK